MYTILRFYLIYYTSTVLFLLMLVFYYPIFLFFFFNDTATTEIYTLSLHDALPILARHATDPPVSRIVTFAVGQPVGLDRKSTRLNSSHANISYAVFCLKKKKNKKKTKKKQNTRKKPTKNETGNCDNAHQCHIIDRQ